MDDFLYPSTLLIILGSLIAIIGTQMTGKARRAGRTVALPPDGSSPLGRGRAVAAGGWFVFLLGFLGLLAMRLV